ncbi:oxidoreductase [Novosphingobium lentum]|uniref:oxidoreductase n=1 Tax=Novosphingobium lentum TaxID=145287 RepID=UPI000837825A|nr:oxidoreductase [Novosphingobium lentum]
MSLSGKTWLITGASAGFGKALVREIVARGGNAVAAARNLDDVADLVALAPERVLAQRLDVTRPGDAESAVAAALDRFGAIDVLANNAGYGFLSTIEEADDAAVRRQFETNVFGPAALMRAALPGMRARRSGFIVNVSSTAGSRGFAGSGYYSASKAALEAMTEALAGEARELGIRAMIVSPGPFRTDFFGRSIALPDSEIADYSAVIAQRRSYAASDGLQQGDPVRGAAIIIDTVTGDDPPLRLVLGGKALPTITGAYHAKLADLARSEPIAPLADFPEGE